MKLHNVQVSAYAGYKADERPLDFIFKGEKHTIKVVIRQTYEETVSGRFRRYTVETGEGITFELCYDENQDQWFLEEQF